MAQLNTDHSFPGFVLAFLISLAVSDFVPLSHFHYEVLVDLRLRSQPLVSSWLYKGFDLLPFHPTLSRLWKYHTADSRHIVQECLRRSQECSWECSVLQQQLELRWAAWGHFLCRKWTCTHQQCLCVFDARDCTCLWVCLCVSDHWSVLLEEETQTKYS